MSMRRTVFMVAIMAAAAMSLSGCNTFRGMGQDIEKGGKQIQTWSDQR